jgi:hypothetical protein
MITPSVVTPMIASRETSTMPCRLDNSYSYAGELCLSTSPLSPDDYAGEDLQDEEGCDEFV